ncbi:MAG: tetratricopeptide repeat protein [Gallionella sp.]|nr:tetratricopeptide repeat protein [Gallionella sp.]
MDFAKPAIWIFPGLLVVAVSAYAEENGQQIRQRAELAAHKTGSAEAYEKLLQQADDLVKGGKPAEAYALLEPLEFEHSGEARFDYLIGIAALDSGKADKATFAFERVLAVSPDNAAARLDMARAYYQLGDLSRARTEFTVALEQNPSVAVRASIQKYLDEIDARKEDKRTRFSAYVEAGFGRDNNVNATTSQSQVFVDVYSITGTLDSSNIKMADNYYALAAGGEINHGLNANWGLYAGADLHKRGNNTQNRFDTASTDARVGIMYEAQESRLRLGLLSGKYDLGGSRYSDSSGFKGEWRHAFNTGDQLNAFAQTVQYRYSEAAMQSNDFDLHAFGIGWQHVLADGGSALSASVHIGTEKDVSPIISVSNPNGGRTDGAKRFRGVRVGGQSALSEKTTLFATAGMQTGDYSKNNYYFRRQRHDRLADLTIGANWLWEKQWALRPQLSYSKNDSNINIYGYDRVDVSLTVRRDFR